MYYTIYQYIVNIKIMLVSTLTNFNWKCKHTWKKSAHNTKWCLIGCAIGDLGTIFYFQINEIAWPTLNIMILAIINGLITSIILETIILLRQNFSLRQAISTALGMSFISMISMEIAMNVTDVIFSAALRSIPNETLDAARIDGASELKIFWSIIIPYLEQTILVIWTIITILVLKVFDIIYAMTNGQWQTEVLANLMYDWMFRGGGDSGRGSVLAFCILIGVIPILAWNLYRHKQEQKV